MEKEGTKKTPEMSVEEILKSIRGIINNHKKENKEEEILELTEVINEKKIPASEAFSIEEDYLISEKSAIEASNSFKNLTEKAKIASKEVKKEKNLTIEELVIAMIKPLLKEWLDTNLPSLVKNIIEKEIKRLIPDEE